jgi:hypothetical protein
MPNDAATGLAYSESGGNATITGRGTYPAGGTLTIPGTVDGYTVTSIASMAFWDTYPRYTSIYLPSSLINLGDAAFGAMSNGLVNVVFAGGWSSGISSGAFQSTNISGSITTTNLLSWPSENYFGGEPPITQASGGGGGGGGLPCFAEGTRVLTQNGYKAIEALKNSDLLTTADGRVIDFKLFKTTLRTTTERTAPYLIQPHAFGRNLPSAPIRLSALHKIQLRKGLWTSAEKAVLSNPLVKQCAIGGPVTYYHIECENYLKDDIVTEGLVVESLGTVKSTGGRSDIYTWNSRLGAYTRIANLENGKSSKTL